jgi:hypothetical protein
MIHRLRRPGALVLVAFFPLLGACADDRPASDSPPALALATGGDAAASAAPADRAGASERYDRVIQVYKTPWCGCCDGWVDHARAAGFEVEVVDLNDLTNVKREHGITVDLASCHTSVVGGYYVEGHVPAAMIERLLREKPEIRGIAVPGMPIGSPGMEGPNPVAYDVIAVGRDGGRSVFERIQP